MAHAAHDAHDSHAGHDSHGDAHGAAGHSDVPPSSPVSVAFAVAVGLGVTALMLWAFLGTPA